ncbi:glycosyl hydrolase [Longispora sp. K20-0274]|uniref:glycoside hydrolase family 26 protein n=1 Tax=Longispora sp. K20-0274 TaxID=3088255 RepID=UPI00399AA4BF
MRSKHLIRVMAILAVAVVEVAVIRTIDIRDHDGGTLTAAQPTVEAPPPTYDVSKLVRPTANKYLGVSVQGGADMTRVKAFGDRMGKSPNMVAVFESFKDGFAASEARKVYDEGGIAFIRWEPFDIPMADIAAGKQDAYITTFAKSVRALNLPIAMTFAHEMNGHWYSWGTKDNTAAEYVAAWRHVHDLFKAQNATNVLWAWTPNVINPVRNVELGPLYPGDGYVDWVGLDGYFTVDGQHTFKDLFGPSIKAVRQFTAKPVVIVETAVEPSQSRPNQITDLLTSVANSPDVIGVLYFDINGSGQWNIDNDPAAVRALREQAAKPVFGFAVKGYAG